MKVSKAWEYRAPQGVEIQGKRYNAHTAAHLAADLPVEELPLDGFFIDYGAPCDNTLRDFVAHMKQVMEADKSYPIILHMDGPIIDGRHRLAKAMLDGDKTIKVKRFRDDPQSMWSYVD